MKALIQGTRIAQIVEDGDEFPCAFPWVDVEADTTELDTWENNSVIKWTATSATVADVKAKASRLILSRYPEWKQINMISRSIELQKKHLAGQTLTASENVESSFFSDAWVWIKQLSIIVLK